MGGQNSWRQLGSGIAVIFGAALLATPTAVLAQEPPEQSGLSESQAADAAFDDALSRHVAKPSVQTRLQLIEVAKPYFALLKPGEPFPEPRSFYDVKSEAQDIAEAAEKSGDLQRAAVAYRLAIALDQGEPGFGPPEPWQGSDIYTVKPLISVLVADNRHDAALAVIRAVLAAPDSDVRDSLFTTLGNDMSDIVYEEDIDAAEAFARMGLAATEGRDARAKKARQGFEEALRILANRRALAAVPAELAAPDPALLDAAQRRAADTLFKGGLARLAANDQAGGAAEMLAAARIYAGAWSDLAEIPETSLGQSELTQVLYRLSETLGADSDAERLELVLRLKIAVSLADPGGPPDNAAPPSSLDAIWSVPPDTDGNVLDGNHGYEVAQLGKVLIGLDRFDALKALARILKTAPDPDVGVQMVGMLTEQARLARQPDKLARAEQIARAGLELYSDAQSETDGITRQFAGLLDWTFEQVPPPAYATLLGQAEPDRLRPEIRAQADDLFRQATVARFSAAHDAAKPLFAEAATLYLGAWPVDFAVPEYRLHQLDLASAASTAGYAALQAGRPAQGELGLRLAEALRNAEIPDLAISRLDGSTTALIAMLQYRRGATDAAGELLAALVASTDTELADQPASTFSSEVYRLKEAGLLNEAEAAARFAVDLYRGSEDRAGGAYGRLALQYGEIFVLKNQPELATQWLQAGWQHRDRNDAGESERAARALIANLVRLGRLDEARPLIAEQAGGPPTLGRAAFRWLLDTATFAQRDDALALQRLARQILDTSGNRDPDDEADLLLALAYGEYQVSNFVEAERLYRQALADQERRFGLDTGGAAMIIQNLAATLLEQGRIDEAEALLRRYMTIAETYEAPDPGAFQESLSNMVDVLLQQDKLDEADDLSARALARFGQDGAAEPIDLAGFETLRARVLFALERLDEAETLLRSAMARSPDARNRSLLAIVLEAKGEPAAATPILNALYDDVLRDTIFTGPYSEARLGLETALARNLALTGKVAEADAMFERTVATLADVFGERSDPYADYAGAYVKHLMATDRIAEARIVAEKVLAARSAARDRLDPSASDTTRLAAARDEADAAATLLRILARSRSGGDPATLSLAFSVLQRAETSAAGLALTSSAATQVAEAAGASDAVAQWRDAQRRLAAIDARITAAAVQGESGDTARKAATAERAAAEQALARAEADLAARFPGFFDLINPEPISLAALQGETGLLRSDEALVILTPGHARLASAEQTGSVMVVTREGAAWVDLPMTRRELIAAITRFHRRLDRSGETNAQDYEPPLSTFSRAESFALYQALFGAPEIASLLSSKSQWTLAPQGAFASLPFAALVTEAPPGGAEGDADPAMLRQTRWLGLQKALAVTPSVSVIGIQRRLAARQTPGARLPFFGLGDPAFKGLPDPPIAESVKDSEAGDAANRGTGRAGDLRGAGVQLGSANSYVRGGQSGGSAVTGLSRLPGTAGEIRALAGQLRAGPDTFVLQLDATEAELRRRNANGSLRDTDVIVLATHGLLAGELSTSVIEPALALTPPSPDAPVTPADDGLLTATEAAQLSLSARFVVLSACNTAASGKPDSESLSGLARAFFFAGAQSLLVTHIYVYDNAAPLLTGEAIRLASVDGLTAAEAMRRSMAALVANETQDDTGRSFAHPKAWAAFAVIDAN